MSRFTLRAGPGFGVDHTADDVQGDGEKIGERRERGLVGGQEGDVRALLGKAQGDRLADPP